jgi:hypothetical protein
MPENQSQPRTDGYDNPQGGPRIPDRAPEPRGAAANRPSDTEAAHAPEEGPSFRGETGDPRPDPLTAGLHGGSGRDRRLDYGNAPGLDGKGDAVRPPDDVEDRVAAVDAHAATVRPETNPGRDR